MTWINLMYIDMLKVKATQTGSDQKLADAAVTGYKIWLLVAILAIHFVQVNSPRHDAV